MNLVIFQQAPDWGGAEEWMATLVRELVKQNVTVTGYTNLPRLRTSWATSGAKTYHLPCILDIIGNTRGLIKSLIKFPFALRWYQKQLKKIQPKDASVILLSGFSEKLLVTVLAKRLNLPVVWFEYGPLGPVFYRHFSLPKRLYHAIYPNVSSIITLSRATKAALVAEGIPAKKIKTIFPGVDIPKEPTRQTQPIVGHLSRLTPEKGQRLLLRAWQIVVKKIPQAHLYIAGQGPDERYLKKLTTRLDLQDSVAFLGFIKDKNTFYRSLKLFVFPSLWDMEGFGLVMIEALSYGIPVIATHRGAAGEALTPKIGSLVNKETPAALAKSIYTALKWPDHAVRNNAARETATSVFNAKIQAGRVLQQLTQAFPKIYRKPPISHQNSQSPIL